MDEALDSYDKHSRESIDLLLKYLLRTYMRMRAKDFVRSLMGRAKTTTTVSHRKEMAAVSNSKLRTSTGSAKAKILATALETAPNEATTTAETANEATTSTAVKDQHDSADDSSNELYDMRHLMEGLRTDIERICSYSS